MITHTLLRRFVSLYLLGSIVLLSLQGTIVNAAMVSTESHIAVAQQQLHNQQVYNQQQLLERVRSEDAKQALLSLGVASADVEKRIASMTPDELAQFNQQVQDLPAGGSGIVGAVVFILVLLIVLDLLGATDIFPVIRPIGSHR